MTNAQYGLVGGINPNRTVGYTLDLVGNRTNVNDGGIGYTYTPNNLNQYGQAGADTVTNGSEHEIASYKNVNYGYINDGRLTTVSSGANVYAIKYDAFGRTVSRTLNGQTTYYYFDGEKQIVETGATVASNVYGLGVDEIVLRFEPSDTLFFYQDHEGSVTHVRNNAGVMVESYRYDAFGAPTITHLSGPAINNRFLFTGREWNATFGFYEYRARAYHPVLGRFMSEDPKGFDAGDYNLFRYCGNDPEDKVDPSGTVAGIFYPSDWSFRATGQGSIRDGGGHSGSPTASQAGTGSDADAVEGFSIPSDTQSPRTASPPADVSNVVGLKFAKNYPTDNRGRVETAYKIFAGSKTGKELTANGKGVTVAPTDRDHPRTSGTSLPRAIYLNPKDPLFLDPVSRIRHAKYNELPPATDKGRAVMFGHEFGHVEGHWDENRRYGGDNVYRVENPLRRDLGIDPRPSYGGSPVPWQRPL